MDSTFDETVTTTKTPFSDDNIRGLFYPERQRRTLLETLVHLSRYGQSPIVVTGCQGIGKTTLKNQLLHTLDQQAMTAIELDTDQLADESTTLAAIARIAGLDTSIDLTLDAVEKELALLANASDQQGVTTLVVIDQAERLSDASLGLLTRLFTRDALGNICLVFFTQPTLLGRLAITGCQPPRENILALETFNAKDTEQYIGYRLKTAGYPQGTLDQGQISQIHEASGGNPGKINVMAETALNITSQTPAKPRLPLPMPHLAAISLTVAIFIIIYSFNNADDDAHHIPTHFLPNPDTTQTDPHLDAVTNTNTNTDTNNKASTELKPEFKPEPKPEQPSAITPPLAAPEALKPVTPAPATPVSTAGPKIELPGKTNTYAHEKTMEPPEKAPPRLTHSLMEKPESHFTLQMLSASEEKTARNFVERYQDRYDTAYYRKQSRGKMWYVVTLGHYTDRQAVERALKALPKPLRKLKPWPRSFGSIHNDIRTTAQAAR